MGRVVCPAKLDWRAGDAPFSPRFQDIYYSAEGGLAESAHVFLKGNGLPQAWRGQGLYCICETGFGSGLNFLACWDLWRRFRAPGQRLHYVAVEKYPLCREDLKRALRPWTELAPLSAQLLSAYRLPHGGFHRLHLEDDVSLTLAVGDVVEVLRALEAGVDAWFLDGFSPANNPEMWRGEMFQEMARLSGERATFATYTAAGFVRRGLAAAGFEVARAPGFGPKREMLRGIFAGPACRDGVRGAPWYRIAKASPAPERHALIIGGGMAGCAVAAALQRRHWRVTLIERHPQLAAEASGNPVGIIMPRLIAGGGAEGRFYAEAYRFAVQELRRLEQRDPGLAQGLTGVLDLGVDAQTRARHAKLLSRHALPDDVMEAVDPGQASNLTGFCLPFPALHFPHGGWLEPDRLCHALAWEARLCLGRSIAKLAYEDGLWRAVDEQGALVGAAPVAVLANGLGVLKLSQAAPLPLKAYRGQITFLGAHERSHKLSKVLTFGSYITPALSGRHVIGATYDAVPVGQDSAHVAVEDKDHDRNLTALRRRVPDLFSWPDAVSVGGRAALRCASPDSHIVAGPVPDWNFYAQAYERIRHGMLGTFPPAAYHKDLYVHTGLGSRGLTTAFLSADLIASQIAGEPWGLARDTAEIMHPGRFMIRALRRAATCSA